MNKPITPNKFATDLWGMMQMAIDEAVAAEREACIRDVRMNIPRNKSILEYQMAMRVIARIEARGQA